MREAITALFALVLGLALGGALIAILYACYQLAVAALEY